MDPLIVAIDARLAGKSFTGDSTYWTGLLHGMSQVESDFRLLLFSNASKPERIPDDPRFEWIVLSSMSSRLWSLVRFPLVARRRGARVLHTQYNVSFLAGPRAVTTVHDASFFLEPSWFRPIDRVLLQRGVPSSARRAAKVVTVSETSKRDIVRFMPEAASKIAVTPLACNIEVSPMPREEALKVVAEMRIEPPFLLAVGTRWPRKNLQLAFEAARLLPRTLPHSLVVAGKAGWGPEEIHERIRLCGYVEGHQLNALYSTADLLLVPSKYEGFGLTLLEGFACGCPVVCSAGGSLPEVAGDAALVIDSWSAGDWARDIENLLGDSSKLAAMREAGRRREKSFSWKRTAELTLEAYKEAAR